MGGIVFNAVKTEAFPSRDALTGGIAFGIQLRNSNGQRYVILDARGSVFLHTPSGSRLYVDQAFMIQPSGYIETARGGELYLRLAMPVTSATAVLLEEKRGNQKVTFRLEIVILALPLDGAPTNNIPPRAEVQTQIVIEKSQWVEEFLPAFGMDNHELWDVRFARMPAPESLKEESDLLRKALHAYNMGEYAASYQNCRQVVERLENREEELALGHVIGSEEWGRAKRYLSIALHADNEIPRNIVRRDAEFALSMTRAILHRVATALTYPDEKTIRSLPLTAKN